MISILIFSLWACLLVCSFCFLSDYSNKFKIEKFCDAKWKAVINFTKRHLPYLDFLIAPSSEARYLEGLIASLTSVDEKVDEALRPLRKDLAKALKTKEDAEGHLAKNQKLLSQWHERAVRAVREGNDVLAKQALARKLHHQKECEMFSIVIAACKSEIDSIRAILPEIEATTQNVSQKMQLFISRAKIAVATSTAHRKAAAALRQAALSKLDMQIHELQNVSEKDLAPLSLLAAENLSKLFASIEIEVSSLEAHVIHWNTSPRPHRNRKNEEAIQSELDGMKQAHENDQQTS